MTTRRHFLRSSAALGVGSLAAAWTGFSPVFGAEERRKAGRTMYIMTDMEGVAGLLDSENWCKPESRYYQLGKEFLTLEVNAAIEGFAKAGITEFLVADGHGHGGISPKLLDPRAQLARNWASPPYPFSMEKGMDFAAWVGQHAMSRTEFAHLAHTGSFSNFETTINGTPVGEFGQCALCAGQLGIRAIFGSGDLAFTKEAQAFVPGIETVAVKRGTTPGRGDEASAEAYSKRNLAAIHVQPERARQMIREGAERAVRRALADPTFGLAKLPPPYERVVIARSDGAKPRTVGRASHPDDVIAVLNARLAYDAPAAKK